MLETAQRWLAKLYGDKVLSYKVGEGDVLRERRDEEKGMRYGRV